MATVFTAPGTPAPPDVDVSGDTGVDQLIDAYRQPAFNLAYRLVRRPEDAADAVQDAFVLAMRASRGSTAAPREPGRFGPWLLKIVANVALAQLRRRKSGTSLSLDALGADLADGRADQPLTAVVQREQRGDVLEALLALPDAQRAALTLREYQGLSYDEIGEMLGMERGAVTALLYRARSGFRAAYEGVAARKKSAGCPELAPLISAMLDEELEPDTWQRVDRHVSDCLRCRRELKQLRRGQRLHSIIPLLAPPAGWSTASVLGAAGVPEAAGLVSTVDKAPSVSGLFDRASELSRPLLAGSLLSAVAALPGGSGGGGLSSIFERGFGKVAGVASAAGLFLAVAAGSPAHHQTGQQTSSTAPAHLAQPTRAESDRGSDLRADPETAERNVSFIAFLPAPPTAWSAPEPAIVVARPSEDVTAPMTEPSVATAQTSGGTSDALPAGEAPAVPAGSEASSPPAPEAATASGAPGAGGPTLGAAVPGAASGQQTADPPPSASTATGAPGTGGNGSPTTGANAGAGVDAGPAGSSGPGGLAEQSLALDLPSIQVPVSGLPPIDLPPIDVPSLSAPTLDVPPVDLPPVDVPAIEPPAIVARGVDLPRVDPPPVDLPVVDLPPVTLPQAELPLADGTLDRVREAAAHAAPDVAPGSKPLASLEGQVEQAIPEAVTVAPAALHATTAQSPDHRTATNVSVSRAELTEPATSVSAGPVSVAAGAGTITAATAHPADAQVQVSTPPAMTGNSQPGTLVDVSATLDPGAASAGPTANSVLTVHTDPSAGGGSTVNNAAGSGNSSTSLVESAVNAGSGSNNAGTNVSVSVDSGTNNLSNNDSNSSNNGNSVSVSVDTSSNGSNSNDGGNTSNGASVSVSVDNSSNSSNSNDGGNTSNGANVSVSVDNSSSNSNSNDGGNTSGSVSVSVSVDTNSSSSNSSDNSGGGVSASVSVGGASVSVSVP